VLVLAGGAIAAPPLAPVDALELVEVLFALLFVLVELLTSWAAATVEPEPQARPVGCCLSSASITDSMREPEPIGPGG
jgi:hypothetical protein